MKAYQMIIPFLMRTAMIYFMGVQYIKDIPGTLPEGRTKPWGTGQAVLAAKKVIKTPFIVINADDYYGREGFKAIHEYAAGEAGGFCYCDRCTAHCPRLH